MIKIIQHIEMEVTPDVIKEVSHKEWHDFEHNLSPDLRWYFNFFGYPKLYLRKNSRRRSCLLTKDGDFIYYKSKNKFRKYVER